MEPTSTQLAELPIARVAVTGATTWSNADLVTSVLDLASAQARRSGGSFRILTGTAEGADDFACRWAKSSDRPLFAEDLSPGTYPGPMHDYNERLLALRPDVVVAFKENFDPNWRDAACVAGTEHLCRIAAEAGIAVLLNGAEWLVPYTTSSMTDDATIVADASVPGALLQVVQGDITRLDVDVVVNAANSSLLGGGGVDGAIHRAAGHALLDACRAIVAREGGCEPGHAVITVAGNLPAQHVVHTVGPIYDGDDSQAALLASCYSTSLQLAADAGATSIAFPNISTGVYRYPKDQAQQIAVEAVTSWLDDHVGTLNRVVFCCFDPENTQLYADALNDLG